MRALISHGGEALDNLTVGEVPDPVATADQVLVRVEAASVDHADVLIATGRYQITVPAPFTPGNNVAGRVVGVGAEVTEFAVGDRVHGMAFVGGFAELVALPKGRLRPTPSGLPAEVACLAGAPYRTAYDALVSAAKVRPGETVVVLGASGAVGSAAVMIAKAIGARVIACASTPAKLAFVTQIGADEGVLTEIADFKERLKELCPGGVDVVLDMVGGDLSEPALRAVGYGGRFVVVGFASGAPARVPLNLPLLKGSTITGYEIASFERREPENAAANRLALEDLLASGRVTPPITARFALDDAVESMRHVSGRDKFGATILQIG